MPLIHFQERFAGAVASGAKRQTIRKTRKRPIKPGDSLILGTWMGSPYRSKVKIICERICLEVNEIVIGLGPFGDEIEIEGIRINSLWRGALARDDGFGCCSEMIDWFRDVHGLPFKGVIIRW